MKRSNLDVPGSFKHVNCACAGCPAVQSGPAIDGTNENTSNSVIDTLDQPDTPENIKPKSTI